MNDKSSKDEHGVLDQDMAVGAYLEALLAPVPETEPEPNTQLAEPTPAMEKPVLVPPVIAPPEFIPVPPEAPTEAEEQIQETPAEVPQTADWELPAWATEHFQVLLFKVAGLQLAVPLVELNGVIHWDDGAVTEMPNHQSWFLGLRDHLEHRVKLIDIAAVVLPPDRYATLGPANGQRLGKVVLIDDYAWGLACEDVAEVVTLSPDDVKWRQGGGGRPWLAGTVVNHMCALLNSQAFAEVLREEGLPQGM